MIYFALAAFVLAMFVGGVYSALNERRPPPKRFDA